MSPIFSQLNVNQPIENLSNPNEILSSESNNTSSDAWLTLELISWQGNSSTTWDVDGTDMDVQFQICIDLDGDSDGISPLCRWTEVWNNTLTLSNAWETTFDLIEDNTTLNITIECWDNDDFADEWGNGPDACDLNPDDDEWRLYYEANWSNITTETFSGDGSKGNDTQWGNAESTWKVTVSYYGDEDNDGVSDYVDMCSNSQNSEEIDEAGCSWQQYDWDNDGILNSVDSCIQLMLEYCGTEGDYISKDFQLKEDSNEQYEIENLAISGDGSMIAILPKSGNLRLFSLTTGELLSEIGSTSGDSSSALMFNQNGSNLLFLTKNGLNAYDTSTYDRLAHVLGGPNDCSGATRSMGMSQDGKYLHAIMRCSLGDPADWEIKVNLTDFAVEDNFQTNAYSQDGDYYYLDRIWEGRFLKADGTSIRTPDGFVDSTEIYMKQDGSIVQEIVMPHETSIAMETVGDQSSVFFARVSGQSTYTTSDYSLMIYNTNVGSQITLPNFELEVLNYGTISKDGSRVVVLYNHDSLKVFERDRDSDGYGDFGDLCPEVAGDFSGCSEEYFDTDEDGVNDKDDQCPGTTEGTNVDAIGCALNQLDSDGDGISDATDQCPNTPAGNSVGLTGCSGSQVDSDGDGIYDSQDDCPSTPSGVTVDSTGCAPDDVVDLDLDGDGVRDSVDACPNSATGIIVDSTGCETNGDVQEVEDEVSSDDSSDALYVGLGLLVLAAVAVVGIRSLNSSNIDSYDRDYGTYSSISNQTISAPETEPNLELQNVIAELERQRVQSEREIRQLKQHQTQQSSASEIAAMQQEMRALQQRVADSEQAKLQLQNEIEQVKSQKDESINMQDSVVGGDMIASGGQKIETQTNVMGTDPEAIARIIFEAQEKERERLRRERN
tara:strand:+ start:264 stop:2936 length:2673 start_codon:yes stop_codon:yes gene_type:complete